MSSNRNVTYVNPKVFYQMNCAGGNGFNSRNQGQITSQQCIQKNRIFVNPNFTSRIYEQPRQELNPTSSKIHVNPKLVSEILLKENTNTTNSNANTSNQQDLKPPSDFKGRSIASSKRHSSSKYRYVKTNSYKLVNKKGDNSGSKNNESTFHSATNQYQTLNNRLTALTSRSKYVKVNNNVVKSSKCNKNRGGQRLLLGKHKLIKIHCKGKRKFIQSNRTLKMNPKLYHHWRPSKKICYNNKVINVMNYYKWASKTRYKVNNMKLKPIPGRTWFSLSNTHINNFRKIQRCVQLKSIHKRDNKSVVNIGGIHYKCTFTTLQRTANSAPQSDTKMKKPPALKLINSGASKFLHTISVQGQKFIMDRKGRSLTKLKESTCQDNKTIKRIDLGGVTYKKKSNDVFIRTNTHRARYVLNLAKQRSISYLINQRKKNNMPCMMYNKFGKCLKLRANKCPYIHLPENVALCQKFLSGKCENSNCLLSHNIVQEKVATCRFFLEGVCARENCPYLHVKVNSKAVICRNFLNGFCSDGQKCKKRHINVCPHYDKTKTCPQGKLCPYPHKFVKKKNLQQHSLQQSTFNLRNEDDSHQRYYQPNTSVSNRTEKNQDNCTNQSTSTLHSTTGHDECSLVLPNRCKLDTLPAYISLEGKLTQLSEKCNEN